MRQQPRNKRSIQAASPYEAVKEAERTESRCSRTMRISNRDFLAGGRVAMDQVEPLSNGTAYIDKWRIQKTSRDEPLCSSQKPFVTALQKNKLFDEIHDQTFINH